MSLSPHSAHPKVYEELALAFREEGTEVFFALLGDGNMHFGAHLAALGVRGIYTRHEHCACAAATAYTNATGRIGVASVTHGPGVTQTMTALALSAQARIPIVTFAGETAYNAAFNNQHIDQAPLVTATGARYIAAHGPELVIDHVREAFFIARTERRPVVLGVPADLQQQTRGKPFAYRPSREFVPSLRPMVPHPDDVAMIVEAIMRSPKVVIVAGRGVMRAGAQVECERLADLCGGLLATTLPARGMFDHHPYSLGIAGGYSRPASKKLLKEADLVLAVGASLSAFTSERGQLFPQSKIIQIDSDPIGIKEGRQAAGTYVRADAREALKAIIERFPAGRPDPSWRSLEVADALADPTVDPTVFPPQPGLVDPRDAVAAIDGLAPKEWEVVTVSGHCSFFTAQLRGRRPENYNVIREFGVIGNGLAYAIGVAAAKPDKTVLLFDGDGSLMMHAQEIETIRRHRLRILICVLNDGAYGSETHKMHAEGIIDEGAAHGRGDIAAGARGFGLMGARITAIDQLPACFEAFRRGEGAMLLDIHIADNVTAPGMRARTHG